MKKKNAVRSTAFFLFAILVTVAIFKLRGSPVRYAVTDLGRGAFAGWFAALDINDRGQILAAIVNPASEDMEKFIIEPDGERTPLSEEFSSFMPEAINNRGCVVGDLYSEEYAVNETAIWKSATGFTTLEGLAGANISAKSLNDAGVVVGASGAALATVSDSFLWSATNGLSVLPRGPRVHTQEAFDINDRGDMVGWSVGAGHAFLRTSSGEMRSLGTIELSGRSIALGCNNHRQVVGYCEIGRFRRHLKRAAHRMIQKVRVSPPSFFSPTTIDRAFLWEDGKMHDLNRFIPPNSGWILIQAHSINDAGQIVGWGTLDGKEHAFLLTPTDGRKQGNPTSQ